MFKLMLYGSEQNDEIMQFLVVADGLLPSPISHTKSLLEFINKVNTYGKICCAVSEGKIIGLACFYCNDKENATAYLTLLAVLPEKQKSGVGSAIILEIERISLESGMKQMKLSTSIYNTNAIKFYEKNGYVITEQFVANDEKRYILTKRL